MNLGINGKSPFFPDPHQTQERTARNRVGNGEQGHGLRSGVIQHACVERVHASVAQTREERVLVLPAHRPHGRGKGKAAVKKLSFTYKLYVLVLTTRYTFSYEAGRIEGCRRQDQRSLLQDQRSCGISCRRQTLHIGE